MHEYCLPPSYDHAGKLVAMPHRPSCSKLSGDGQCPVQLCETGSFTPKKFIVFMGVFTICPTKFFVSAVLEKSRSSSLTNQEF